MGSRLTRGGGAASPREERPRSASVQGVDRWPGVRGRDSALAALLLRPERLLSPKRVPAPYVRRVSWIREIQALLREHRAEQAVALLGLLRKDLGLEGTSLNDMLYKHTAFLNLVDPISHDLLMSLARDIHCPKKELESLKSAEKLCRQLIYHLTPHSKWQRQSMSRRSQACLKSALQKKIADDSLDLSGMPLPPRDVQRVAYHLQLQRDRLTSIDLSFTEMTDGNLQFLLPFLAGLPRLTNLALNGNRLTKLILKDMTDMIKEPNVFPALSWVDLGNNTDICSMPQPLLVGLRRRCSLQGALPTIQEHTEGQVAEPEVEPGAAPRREQGPGISQSQEEKLGVTQSQEQGPGITQSQEEEPGGVAQPREELRISQSQGKEPGVSQSQEVGPSEITQSQEEEPGFSQSQGAVPGEGTPSREGDDNHWQVLQREAGAQQYCQR
ncbi:leucine-rich repeat-containing protein 75B-like [Leucoraja erinacea]|uniref:leucine-rich repeat-containing protein 75B-like n=1 Tax=Leucoraja erinaceus TaxID=7782 RepID=UPI002457E5EB|nr:leucine-rich repeat-containing protein 75B-like [Leucoraja erinacea]